MRTFILTVIGALLLSVSITACHHSSVPTRSTQEPATPQASPQLSADHQAELDRRTRELKRRYPYANRLRAVIPAGWQQLGTPGGSEEPGATRNFSLHRPGGSDRLWIHVIHVPGLTLTAAQQAEGDAEAIRLHIGDPVNDLPSGTVLPLFARCFEFVELAKSAFILA